MCFSKSFNRGHEPESAEGELGSLSLAWEKNCSNADAARCRNVQPQTLMIWRQLHHPRDPRVTQEHSLPLFAAFVSVRHTAGILTYTFFNVGYGNCDFTSGIAIFWHYNHLTEWQLLCFCAIPSQTDRLSSWQSVSGQVQYLCPSRRFHNCCCVQGISDIRHSKIQSTCPPLTSI